MEFYINIGFTVLLQVLKDRKKLGPFRKAFAKLYLAIEDAFAFDPEFQKIMNLARGVES